MPIFTRPRRSRCYTRVVQRDRSQLRAFDRCCRVPEPVTFVRETHGQVLRADVRRLQDVERASRLIRAEAALARADRTLDHAVAVLTSVTTDDHPSTMRRADAAEAVARAQYVAAKAELKAAKTSAARPVGDLVTPAHAPVTLPDRWPFPGSCTSRLRAIRAIAARGCVLGIDAGCASGWA